MIIDQTHQVRPGMTGESVTNLHRRLVLAGLTVPADELCDDRFGPGTVEAIRQFQLIHGLPPHGELDDLTAHGLGIAMQPRAISGMVCQPDGAPLGDVAVRLHQDGAGGKQVVAETRSGADGKFALPWPAGATGGLTLQADGAVEKPVSWKALPSSGPFWVRLSVGGEYRGASTFALLTSALIPAVEDGALRALGRADRRQADGGQRGRRRAFAGRGPPRARTHDGGDDHARPARVVRAARRDQRPGHAGR
jgi:peptidoglycan hydrolase-like protein with peptidoglycan-binding domain